MKPTKEESTKSFIADRWRHCRRLYARVGWPGLLPEVVGIHCFAFRKVKREFGWAALLLVFNDLTFTQARQESGREFRRFVCMLLTTVTVLTSAIWAFVRFKPWIWTTAAKATSGITFRLPRLPFDLPAISLHDLFTWNTFLHYGWVAIILAFVLIGGRKAVEGLTGAVIGLFIAAIMIAGAYAATIGPAWPATMTTDGYFSFAAFLPVVMPMDTFMFDLKAVFFEGMAACAIGACIE